MSHRPPRLWESLMGWSLPPDDEVAVLGDLEEEFDQRRLRDGEPAARAWYRRQVWRSVGTNIRHRNGRHEHHDPTPLRRVVAGGILQDVRYALRSLRSTPGFTVAALLILTLGIGASTAIFSVVDAVVLRGLPFEEHDRLVAVGQRMAPRPDAPGPSPGADPEQLSSVSPQNYLDWAARQQVFESMAAIVNTSVTLREADAEPEDLRAQRVTSGFFDVLKAEPRLGRRFTTENEVDGQDQVVVLSDGLWKRRFGGEPDVVGRVIPIDGALYEVLGVMPPEFAYPVGVVRPTDVWLPLVVPPRHRVRIPNNYENYLQTIGRLGPGMTLDGAKAHMAQIASALEAEHPAWNKGSLAGVRPLHDHFLGARTRSWMVMLLGAVGLVLLIACANVANLLLVRAAARERELSIRAALGAGRWRLVRQALVESVVLSGVATILSIGLAWWAVDILRAAMPDGVPRVTMIAIDMRVLAGAAAAALFTGVLFGVVPALQSSRPALAGALKEGARGHVGGRQYVRHMLVVAEVALAVVLLVGAALFTGSFLTLMRIDPGFDATNVLTVQIAPRAELGQPPRDERAAYARIIDELGQTPGVQYASMILGGMPFSGSMSTTTAQVVGSTPMREVSVSVRRVTADYHHALKIPLLEGRYFGVADREGAPPVVVLNKSAAAVLFPGEQALGRLVNAANADRTVVGIVGDIHQSSLEVEGLPEIYAPIAQVTPGSGELMIRTAGDPFAVLPAVKAAVLRSLPDVPLRNVRSLEQVFERRAAQRRLNMLLIGLFGALGLVISAVGLYGVMAYAVSQRTREIGVRMALGATQGSVMRMVMHSAGVMVVTGLVIGAAGAWWLSTFAGAFLFRIEATDPRAFGVAIAVLLLAAAMAAALPARRAAAVDPMVALRAE
jgi:putative ABC transport system permease protein